MKTRTVRIRVADLSRLHELRVTEDETPSGVIHRVLAEYDDMQRTRIQSVNIEDFIKKYESLIEKQKEKIITMRRKIGELKHTVEVLKSVVDDANENRGEGAQEYVERIAALQKEKEEVLNIMRQMTADYQAALIERNRMIAELEDELRDENEHICVGSGTTININVFKGSRTGVDQCNDTK
ncbi:MAG: hypothetical protein J7K40_05455 [candidate division Zixibacteria bacterium]|nr:hypothetical protein [candidate division Zixibacteria bacterium]